MVSEKQAWEDLANAVVLQAMDDYLSAKIRLRKRPDLKKQREKIRELEDFFRSKWCHICSSMDEETIRKTLSEKLSGPDPHIHWDWVI